MAAVEPWPRPTAIECPTGSQGDGRGAHSNPRRTQRRTVRADLWYWPSCIATRSSSRGAGEHVSLFGKQCLDPIDDRAHARRAPQIAVDDDPVFGRDFRNRRGQPLEQGMTVADI